MMSIKMHYLVVLCLLFVIPSLSNAQSRLVYLEEVRNEIVFPELTLEEKTLLVEQAQQLLTDLYVNRFDKLDFYEDAIDPVFAIEDLVFDIENLSTEEIELRLFDIFSSQRDLHLNYVFPSPHSTYSSLLPLSFTRTLEFPFLPERKILKYSEVRVEAVNADLFELFASGETVPAVGDVIISYGNQPVKKAIEERVVSSQGANDFGGFTRAMNSLTFIPHLLRPVPSESEVTMTFIASGNGDLPQGEVYSITLPWITSAPELVEAPSTASTIFSALRSESTQAKQIKQVPEKLTREGLFESRDLWQEEYNKVLARYDIIRSEGYPENPSAEPTLTWGIIENTLGEFGYIRLSSFVPETGINATLVEVQRLLFEELAGTTGLIFDIRNNGGGAVDLANGLYQLFSPTPVGTMGGRVLNSDLNRELLNNTFFGSILGQEWIDNINAVEGTNQALTDTSSFTDDAFANSAGQYYYNPVAVLANASSYSASDLFACSMQDNEAALLYGEEPRTGAGGANVWEHSLFNLFAPAFFPALPGDHRMRVSWGQLARFGPNEGKIIEDFGCRSDIDVSPSSYDLFNENAQQIAIITKSLFLRSFKRRYHSSVIPSTGLSDVISAQGAAFYKITMSNTDKVEVYKGGELLKVEDVGIGYRPEEVTIELDDLETGKTAITFVGINNKNKVAWNVKRNFVVFGDKVTVDSELGFSKEFSDGSVEPLTIFNGSNSEVDGWQLVDDALQIGFNPSYSNDVNTDAALVLDLSNLQTATLSFDMEYFTELAFDFVQVTVEDIEGNSQQILRESGEGPLQTYFADISSFAGKEDVVLRFNFSSDALVVDEGVKLYGFSISHDAVE